MKAILITRLKYLLFLTVPACIICLLLLEVFFRLVIPACQFPDPIWDREYSIIKFDPEHGYHEGHFTIGKFAKVRTRYRINLEGWNSDIEYALEKKKDLPRVCIIGDSYIEAFSVNVEKSCVSQLRGLLRGKAEVYGFGISGAPLSQYLQISRYVSQRFDADILIINMVHNDLHESLVGFKASPNFLQIAESGTGFTEVPPVPYRPSPLRRLLKHSAFIRYLTENLKIRGLIEQLRLRGHSPQYVANVNSAALRAEESKITSATFYLIQKLKQENPKRYILIVMDAPRGDVEVGTTATSKVLWMNQLVESACATSGIDFLDLTDPFTKDWEINKVPFEVPQDGHWNERSHRIVAEAYYARLHESGWDRALTKD